MWYYNKVNKLNFLFLIQHSRSAHTKTLGWSLNFAVHAVCLLASASVELGFHWTKPRSLKLMIYRWVLCLYWCFKHRQPTYITKPMISLLPFCITKDVNMKKIPPALIVYTTLATLIASTPEYIILLDTVICTAAGIQCCKQFSMWLRASRWLLSCSGQYFYCQQMLSQNGEQTGTFKQWENSLSISFLLPGLFSLLSTDF